MTLPRPERRVLLSVARTSIRQGLERGRHIQVDTERYSDLLREPRASFVTLRLHDRLRGCIGTLAPERPLVQDVAYHAHAAAFRDPRFPRLDRSEWAALSLHISILSHPEPLGFADEADLVRSLRPGTDGVIIERGTLRATFLPAVWDSLPDAGRFVAALKEKAGIPPEQAPERAYRYSTESFSENDFTVCIESQSV